MTCKKAHGYLDSISCKLASTVDSGKKKYGPTDALALLETVDKLIAIKGKKVVSFDLRKERPDDEAILALIIGPTGNLRAPTSRVGKTLIVGFNEEAYEDLVRSDKDGE